MVVLREKIEIKEINMRIHYLSYFKESVNQKKKKNEMVWWVMLGAEGR